MGREVNSTTSADIEIQFSLYTPDKNEIIYIQFKIATRFCNAF